MNMSVRQGMKDIASSHLKDISDYIVYDNDSIVLKKVFEGGPSISIEERV